MIKALGRVLFWEFPRASWQYDIVVALILAFIFLTPREVFRDQPRPASVVLLPDEQGYLIESRLLDGIAPEDRARKATELVYARYKTRTPIVRVEPIVDDVEGEVVGYKADTKK